MNTSGRTLILLYCLLMDVNEKKKQGYLWFHLLQQFSSYHKTFPKSFQGSFACIRGSFLNQNFLNQVEFEI